MPSLDFGRNSKKFNYNTKSLKEIQRKLQKSFRTQKPSKKFLNLEKITK